MKTRLDQLLVERGLCQNREEAEAQIRSGNVVVNDQRVEKPGTLFANDVLLRLKAGSTFVSRGGDKLLGAIKDLGLEESFRGASVLDLGASTGGFCDCALALGAASVVAVDIGFNQLAWKLRQDPRVRSLEKTDFRELEPEFLRRLAPLDYLLADLSFVALADVSADIKNILELTGSRRALLLIKPEFELPLELVPKGGVVRDASLHRQAVESVLDHFEFWETRVVPSRVRGRRGNLEFFLFLSPENSR